MAEIDQFLAEAAAAVEACLDALIPGDEIEPAVLHQAIRWSVFAGGKRIRPALVIAAGEAFGARRPALITTAAAIEMVHTYSLIHDDLPSMDDDSLRRGRATCHIKFGEATAILAGDVLQSLAYEAIANDDLLGADTRVRLIALIARATGTPGGMVAGQQMDLDGEGRSLEIGGIEDIHRRKTGALMSASAVAGAVIAGASDRDVASVERYASNLGLLFQITDDLLDVTQSTNALGKTAGKDANAAKATYPSLMGVEAARKLSSEVAEAARASLTGLNADVSTLSCLVDIVFDRSH